MEEKQQELVSVHGNNSISELGFEGNSTVVDLDNFRLSDDDKENIWESTEGTFVKPYCEFVKNYGGDVFGDHDDSLAYIGSKIDENGFFLTDDG